MEMSHLQVKGRKEGQKEYETKRFWKYVQN